MNKEELIIKLKRLISYLKGAEMISESKYTRETLDGAAMHVHQILESLQDDNRRTTEQEIN
jgi:hypothetical protein